MAGERYRYSAEPKPIDEDLSRFREPYVPEQFTQEEVYYLRPFFSNLDRRVYVVSHLEEEVVGALASKYSRSRKSMRRVFLDEYVWPIVHPELQKDWQEMDDAGRKAAYIEAGRFRETIVLLTRLKDSGATVGIGRGRKFYETWLNEFGDESIAEEAMVHMCIDGMSSLVLEELVSKRVGISMIIKSSRYVQSWERRRDGQYQYVVPGEIRETAWEGEYRRVVEKLFAVYERIAGPYLDYIREKYPRGDDESDGSFAGSRSAKRFDDLRDLLPFALQTNGGFLGNMRAWEDVINRLLSHPIGEFRALGQDVCRELESVVPSLVRRPRNERGVQMQLYRDNLRQMRDVMLAELNLPASHERGENWVELLAYSTDSDVEILTSFLFSAAGEISYAELWDTIYALSPVKRAEMLRQILNMRQMGEPQARREVVRFRKVPRAFESGWLLFGVWGRSGDFRDVHRHRMGTIDYQRFTTNWGFDLEEDLVQSPFYHEVLEALAQTAELSERMAQEVSPWISQYVVPFAAIAHWYMLLSPRGVYWPVELRTGPQGRSHYRRIFQEIARLAKGAMPAVFSGLMVDENSYPLSRRESEKKVRR